MSAVATKIDRIEIETDPDTQAKIAEAARAQHLTVSAFVLEAASAAADRVLGRGDRTVVPADQFDALMAGLDEPEDVPTLTQLASRQRRFSRR